MSGVTGTTAFLFMWIGFLALMLAGLSLILLWAVRAGQFSNQERARYLPLRSGIPGPDGLQSSDATAGEGESGEGARR